MQKQKFTFLSVAAVAVGSFAGLAQASANLVVSARSGTYSSTESSYYACEESHLKNDAIQQCREAGYDAVPTQLENSQITREFRLLSIHDDEDLELIRDGWASTCLMSALYRCQNQADLERIKLEAQKPVCYINAYAHGFRKKKTAYEVRMRAGNSNASTLLKGKFSSVEAALQYLLVTAPKFKCAVDRSVQ